MKAKYFSKGSFLNAQLGSRPSFAWCSILAAQELLWDGLIWRIRDGKSVSIRGDRWLPTPSSFTPQFNCCNLATDAKVGDLIDLELKGWNKPLIYEHFNEDEAKVICNLPLGRYQKKDKLIWRVIVNGIFYVRSAYFMELDRKASKMGEGSTKNGDSPIWKMIWNM